MDRHVERSGHEVLLNRLAALPGSFPHTKAYTTELTSGSGADRFAFTLQLMLAGLGATEH